MGAQSLWQETKLEDGREDFTAKEFFLFVLQKPPFRDSFYQFKGKQCARTILACASIDSPQPRILILPPVLKITCRSKQLHF